MKNSTTFEQLGINCAFKTFVDDTVYVKIDESRYIQLGKNGAECIEDRTTEIRPFLFDFPNIVGGYLNVAHV